MAVYASDICDELMGK